MKKIQEGKAIIEIPDEKKISKKLPVFYNPAMKLNRDISVLLLNAVDKKKLQIAEIMAGTGVRSIRFAKELKKGKIKSIAVNDFASINYIKKNFKANKVKANFYSLDANEFLLQSSGFDYIDVDPFGTPNDFLDASLKRIGRDGILAVTATDTAALCGTYPKTGRREYWAETHRNGFMHESALRILARKVQLVGSQYSRAMIPIFSYAKEHYIRIFFKCIKSRETAADIIKQHKYVLFNPKTLAYEVSSRNFKEGHIAIGPMYVGSLSDKTLVAKMLHDVTDPDAKKLLTALHEELDVVGSYDVHMLCKVLKITSPRFDDLLIKLHASRTHYNLHAIKTNKTIEEIKKLLV